MGDDNTMMSGYWRVHAATEERDGGPMLPQDVAAFPRSGDVETGLKMMIVWVCHPCEGKTTEGPQPSLA